MQKYQSLDLLISIPQAITYFDDADETQEPVSLKGQNWKKIKLELQKAVSEYLR